VGDVAGSLPKRWAIFGFAGNLGLFFFMYVGIYEGYVNL